MPRQKLQQVGAGWIKQGSKQRYLSVSLQGQDYLMFKNSNKNKDNDPDYLIFRRPKNNNSYSVNKQTRKSTVRQSTSNQIQNTTSSDDEDEIMF